MRFEKTALTIPEQIQQLEDRGMEIPDKAKAQNYLSNISYYRLSAYWYTFISQPKAEHNFIADTTFDKVISTYVFDRRLRLMIFDEIERLEISVRTQIIHHYCCEFGNNWFENETLFRKPANCQKLFYIIQKELAHTSEVFIKHYQEKYTIPEIPPAWMSLELLSFGQISLLYKNLKTCKAKKAIAEHYGVHENVLVSWLESLSYIRNTCAHHSRLWNKKMPKPILLPNRTDSKWLSILPDTDKANRIYPALAAILYLLRYSIPTTSFRERLFLFLNEYPDIPKGYMGFPKDWGKDDFWT